MDDEYLPAAHPAFSAHFTDPLYQDPADDLAPFGSDEGADMLAEWDERRDELGPDTTVSYLLEHTGEPDTAAEGGDGGAGAKMPWDVDTAVWQVSAAFTLLRLTGHIDEAGKVCTLEALDFLIQFYGPQPELVRQREDLRTWQG